jgi:hypothetical protein
MAFCQPKRTNRARPICQGIPRVRLRGTGVVRPDRQLRIGKSCRTGAFPWRGSTHHAAARRLPTPTGHADLVQHAAPRSPLAQDRPAGPQPCDRRSSIRSNSGHGNSDNSDTGRIATGRNTNTTRRQSGLGCGRGDAVAGSARRYTSCRYTYRRDEGCRGHAGLGSAHILALRPPGDPAKHRHRLCTRWREQGDRPGSAANRARQPKRRQTANHRSGPPGCHTNDRTGRPRPSVTRTLARHGR